MAQSRNTANRTWQRTFRTVADVLAARSAVVVCALFVLAGAVVLDDYGEGLDEKMQRDTAQIVLDYVWGRSDKLLRYEDRMYGVAVEAPLLWAERLLGLQDSRAIYLLRHLLTHLLFLAGGLGAAALAFRLYGSRRLALCALGLFLLHPRLYAHSFFNSKDLPFLSLFMLTLLLMHWAFRRGTGPAFALCGAGIGALINVWPMGLLLFAGVLALRACDIVYAADGRARRQILRTGGLFVVACALMLYALWPYLWSDPVRRLAESLAYLADYPNPHFQLFRGRYVNSVAVPPEYVPVWFAITAPPHALLLGLVGLTALAWRVRRQPGGLRSPRVRFEGLALACCVLPVLAVILLGSTLYNGWRYLYFLYAPFCLLAAIGGLHALGTSARRLRRGGGGAYGLAGAGAAAMLGALISLHPYQHLYFNFLVDRATPEHLLFQYDLDYWRISLRNVLKFLLAQYPDAPIYVQSRYKNGRYLLPATDRQRLALADIGGDFYIDTMRELATADEYPRASAEYVGDFYIANRRGDPGIAGTILPYAPIIHTQKAYGNTLALAAAVNLEKVDAATAAPYRATYRALTAREPVVRGPFDVYLDADAVSWIRDPCQPEDTDPRFLLYLTPADPQDLPAAQRRRFGFDHLNFNFSERGVRLDGACLAVVPRPAYPVRHLTVGQFVPKGGPMLWQADFTLPLARGAAHEYRAAYRTLAAQPPTHRARSTFTSPPRP